ncbi:MAG: adenylosuccinate synthase, partial [Thermoleophilaceae bacterium]|nr:adenylosuccinate synthase [Thermoleophilaceae bacterium]
RRCGWLDLVALKYGARINGLTGLVVTKLDALSGLGELGVAVRYKGPEGAIFEQFPYHQTMVHKARADYEMMPGWDEDIGGARTLDELPQNARNYLDFISDFIGVPIVLVGVGPARDQVIWTGRGAQRYVPVPAPSTQPA